MKQTAWVPLSVPLLKSQCQATKHIGVHIEVCYVDESMFFDKLLSDFGGLFNGYDELSGVTQEFGDAVFPSLRLAIVNAIT